MDFDEEPSFSLLRDKYPFPFDGKVLFKESTHTYGIIDETTGEIVTDNIISVSSLFKKNGDDDMTQYAGMAARGFRNRLLKYLRFLRDRPAAFARPYTYRERHKQFDGGDLSRLSMDYLPKKIYEKLETNPGCDLKVLSVDERMEVYGALLAGMVPFDIDGPDPCVEFVDWEDVKEHYPTYKSNIPFPLDAAGVRMKWDEWCNAGTRMHAYIEHLLNGVQRPDVELEDPESEGNQIRRFLASLNRKVIRTELRVASLKHRICGTLDALVMDAEGKLYIYDWKRSRNVFNPSTQRRGRSYVSYQQQLTCYRKLLKLNGVETEPIGVLGVIHPLYEDFQLIELDLEERADEVEKRFEERLMELEGMYKRARIVDDDTCEKECS